VINVGQGAQLVEADLLGALASGQIAAAPLRRSTPSAPNRCRPATRSGTLLASPSRRTSPPARRWPSWPGRRSRTWRRSTTACARSERSTKVADTDFRFCRQSGR
jgi:hypothetical protein